MKTNNQPKSKNKIFIIWGLFISAVILIFLIILLLIIKPESKTQTQNQPTLNSQTNPQQEQETYNRLMNKIDKEIDDLINKKETFYQPDGTTISKIEIKNSEDKLIKRIVYFYDGKKIQFIDEYNQDTGQLIKETEYDKNGNISSIEEYQKGFLSKSTYFNPDGTIKEIINH